MSHRNQANDLLLTGFYMMGNFAFDELMFYFLKSNFQWYHRKLHSVEKPGYFILFCRINNVLFLKCLYFIIFVRNEINAYVRINTDCLFIKIMMVNSEACPAITPKSIFFEGVIAGHHFWRYGAVLPENNFTFRKFITFLSLLPKQISQH